MQHRLKNSCLFSASAFFGCFDAVKWWHDG